MLAALCDAGADATITSADGQTAANICATHEVFQIIRERVEQQSLEDQLRQLQQQKTTLQITEIRSRRGNNLDADTKSTCSTK